MEIADRKVLLELAPQVFERVHRLTPGSDRRGRRPTGSGPPASSAGTAARTRRSGAPCTTTPPATVDGYVSYKFAGWDTKPYTMEVVDLVAATDAAYLELWQFLGSIDLVERISWQDAPVDDPLTWALEDPRCVESSDHRDMLWLRILDPAQALGARRYSADGSLVLAVSDGLGFAAGTFVLEVSGGEADGRRRLRRPAGPVPGRRGPRLDLPGRRLSGDADGGRADHRARPGAALTARLMFAVERSPHCLTHF